MRWNDRFQCFLCLGNIEGVKELIKTQDINALDMDGSTALHLAAEKGIFLLSWGFF